jgi:hypothetical protein
MSPSSHGERTCRFLLRLASEKLAESLSSFADDDAPSICKLNAENSSNVVNILYGYFCYKKNKLKWAGSLQDLKAFVLTEVNELVAGTWKFDSEVLFVTWQTKSQNIYFEGEKSKDVTKRITSLLKANMLQ